jgi:hypothetical protein
MKYLVRWEIDSDAATPLEAAREARAAQRDPFTVAVVFDVFEVSAHGKLGKMQRVDLDKADNSDDCFVCRGCGREESVCSANPCAGVIADREATL